MKLRLWYFMVVMNAFVWSDSLWSSLIPRHVLFSTSAYEAPSISPDGSKIAYLASCNGVLNIWVRSVGRFDDHQITHEMRRGIRRYFWSPDSSKVFYLQDVFGDEKWHIFCVDLASLETTDLTPFPHVRASIIAVENSIKDHILVGLNLENQRYQDVYKLHIATGTLTLSVKNPGNVIDWFADRFLHVRCAVRTNADGGRDVMIRRLRHVPWKVLFSWTALEALSCSVKDISYNGDEIFCLDNRFADTTSLTSVNMLFNTRKVIGYDERYDISGVLIHPRLRTIQAYTVIKQRKEIVFLDKAFKEDFELLRRFRRGDIALISRDFYDSKWIVAHVCDDRPISYSYFDRSTKNIEPLFENKPDLSRYQLAPTEFVTMHARDGVALEGYCVKPLHWSAGVPMPLVIVVHGGPWSRDTWGYDMEAQWLANRGYICLRINYRGSLGYGKTFLGLGVHQWGGSMLNDIVDAAQWAVKEGLADPKRIGVMGFSFGGYTALCAATMTHFFAGAISIVGPSNLVGFLTSLPPYFEPMKKLLYTVVGDPIAEQDFLQRRSPLFHVHNIRVPLLIAQGVNDPRVSKAETDQFVDALKAQNLIYDYVLFPDEGHGLAQESNRLMFYARAEQFLANVLQGLCEV